jgi:hypothetical protein
MKVFCDNCGRGISSEYSKSHVNAGRLRAGTDAHRSAAAAADRR